VLKIKEVLPDTTLGPGIQAVNKRAFQTNIASINTDLERKINWGNQVYTSRDKPWDLLYSQSIPVFCSPDFQSPAAELAPVCDSVSLLDLATNLWQGPYERIACTKNNNIQWDNLPCLQLDSVSNDRFNCIPLWVNVLSVQTIQITSIYNDTFASRCCVYIE
jgi:hypothetical protein